MNQCNRIVITNYNGKILIINIKNNEVVKVRVIKDIYESVDKVYFGRVKNVKNNIASCFLTYGDKKKGFLGTDKYKPETVVPVMLKKKNTGKKEDVLTDNIIISGVFLVYTGSNAMVYSKRFSKSKREILKDTVLSGTIVRVNAANTDLENIISEYHYLYETYKKIMNRKDMLTENCILHDGIPLLIKHIYSEDLSEYDEVMTDIEEVSDVIEGFRAKYKELGINIELPVKTYLDQTISMGSLLSISSMLTRAFDKKVFLKSDAYLVIEYTEAAVVIDVNSGTTNLKGDKGKIIHEINLEAVKEIAAQTVIRNLSGIIIVDLINEYNSNNYDELVELFNELSRNDECHAKCHSITELGLMQITRDRKELMLKDQLNI